MQASDWMKMRFDRIESTIRETGKCFEPLSSEQTRMLWKHSRIPNMVLCVEQEGIMDSVDQDSDAHDILLVGEESDPDSLYPFDDVCSCWAGGWQGSLPTKDPQRENLATRDLPTMIDRCVDASVASATQQGEPAEGDDPPGPVLSLAESLAIVDKHADEIRVLFSAERIASTRSRLKQRRQGVYGKIGLDLGHDSMRQEHASVREEVPLGLAAQSV